LNLFITFLLNQVCHETTEKAVKTTLMQLFGCHLNKHVCLPFHQSIYQCIKSNQCIKSLSNEFIIFLKTPAIAETEMH